MIETLTERVSIIIPTHKEPYIQVTVDDICSKAKGDFEIIVILDGYWPSPILKSNPKLTIIHRSKREGMRKGINSGARIAKGKYLLKCDGHVSFDEGFDLKLATDCRSDWTIVPVRYDLNVKDWSRQSKKVEFQYIEKDTLKGRNWPEYEQRVNGEEIVDLMTSQGSCWFMHKDWFDKIGGEDDINYGGMGREAQEICLKTWLSGGRYVLNRKTWYAHWSKPSEFVVTVPKEKEKSVAYAVDFWKNKWKGQRDLNWLVDKFKPVPTWEGGQQ